MRAFTTLALCGSALLARAQEPENETEKRTQRIVEGINTTAKQTRSMLQSLLLANSQSMFSVTNMQKAVTAMREQLDNHDKKLEKCESELKEFKSATKYSQQTWAAQHQINTVSLVQTEAQSQTESS